jgi:hypothetical protein
MPHDTRRGFIPADAEDFGEAASVRLREAQKHIRYLLDQGYGLEASVNFAGNHFQFSARQRLALLRATCGSAVRKSRLGRMLRFGGTGGAEGAGEFRPGDTVHVDGFNTIITLEAALSEGTTLLRCMDGAVRDLCGLHGTYRIIESTGRALAWIAACLKQAGAAGAIFYLDAPVSNSGKLSILIRRVMEEKGCAVEVRLPPDSDRELFGKGNVASSDAVVLDRCSSWLNLAGAVMAEHLPRRPFVELDG